MPTWKVDCWNCNEGFVEPVDEWDGDICDHCKGKGYLVVTEPTTTVRAQFKYRMEQNRSDHAIVDEISPRRID